MHDHDLEDLDASLTPIPLEETVCTTAPDFSINFLTVEQAEKAFRAAFDDAQLDQVIMSSTTAGVSIGDIHKLPPVTSTAEQPWPEVPWKPTFTSEQIKTLRMAALDQAVKLGMDPRNCTQSAAMIVNNARAFEYFLLGVDSK
jgi:hypothetical protein